MLKWMNVDSHVCVCEAFEAWLMVRFKSCMLDTKLMGDTRLPTFSFGEQQNPATLSLLGAAHLRDVFICLGIRSKSLGLSTCVISH